MEEPETLWERRDKFRADWIPEAMPELEAMVRDEVIQELMERALKTCQPSGLYRKGFSLVLHLPFK